MFVIKKNPGVAAVLSLVLLGAGQIYNEQIGKACFCWLLGLIGGVVIGFGWVVIGTTDPGAGILMAIGGIVVLFAYMFSIWDALGSAREINRKIDNEKG